jgi:hypothetical protein
MRENLPAPEELMEQLIELRAQLEKEKVARQDAEQRAAKAEAAMNKALMIGAEQGVRAQECHDPFLE